MNCEKTFFLNPTETKAEPKKETNNTTHPLNIHKNIFPVAIGALGAFAALCLWQQLNLAHHLISAAHLAGTTAKSALVLGGTTVAQSVMPLLNSFVTLLVSRIIANINQKQFVMLASQAAIISALELPNVPHQEALRAIVAIALMLTLEWYILERILPTDFQIFTTPDLFCLLPMTLYVAVHYRKRIKEIFATLCDATAELIVHTVHGASSAAMSIGKGIHKTTSYCYNGAANFARSITYRDILDSITTTLSAPFLLECTLQLCCWNLTRSKVDKDSMRTALQMGATVIAGSSLAINKAYVKNCISYVSALVYLKYRMAT